MEKETTTTLTKVEDIPCCPEFDKCPPCDVLDMRRRLSFPTAVRTESGQPVTVGVILHTRFSRCSGPLALGDIVYTTTLLLIVIIVLLNLTAIWVRGRLRRRFATVQV